MLLLMCREQGFVLWSSSQSSVEQGILCVRRLAGLLGRPSPVEMRVATGHGETHVTPQRLLTCTYRPWWQWVAGSTSTWSWSLSWLAGDSSAPGGSPPPAPPRVAGCAVFPRDAILLFDCWTKPKTETKQKLVEICEVLWALLLSSARNAVHNGAAVLCSYVESPGVETGFNTDRAYGNIL